jgi:transposase
MMMRGKKKKQRITNLKSIGQRDLIGDGEAFMDIGLNNLFAVVVSDGSALLVKGGSIESEYYWWKREIATYQSIRDLLRRLGGINMDILSREISMLCIRGMRGLGISI